MNINFQHDRSPRVKSRPETFRYYANFRAKGENHAAQFTDISLSGMRLLSRQPSKLRLGEFIELEFSLPGSGQRVTHSAMVVRKDSEYDFSVRFLLSGEKQKVVFRDAFSTYVSHLRKTSYAKLTGHLNHWAKEHKRGLWVSMFGLALAVVVSAVIYSTSDQHIGRALAPWGKIYPKSWYFDYYNGK